MNRYAARAMALDPRTPIVVGVGQVTTPPDAGVDAAERPEPLELMTAALRVAAEDCDGATYVTRALCPLWTKGAIANRLVVDAPRSC